MIENQNDFLDDPRGCREDLRDALADPDLGKVGADGQADPDGARAAYRLALSLGYCRLFGVEPGDELDGVLPLPLALAAVAELTRLLQDRSAQAATLAERWDRTVDPAEADDLCAGLLNLRMEAWAAGITLDEALLDGAQEGDPRGPVLAAGIDRFHDALDRFDAALEEQFEVLATIAHTHLLENWRVLLAPVYREALPWWLDGRLEAVARRLRDEAVRTLPNSGAWAETRRRAAAALVLTAAFSRLLLRARRAGRAGEPEPPPVPLKWVSPEGAVAFLKLPLEGETTLTVQFFTADRDPATVLDTQPAWLAGVPSEIRGAKATFSLAAVEESEQDLRLEVGPDRATWQPDDPTNVPRGAHADPAR
jgi:hypothetical protein